MTTLTEELAKHKEAAGGYSQGDALFMDVINNHPDELSRAPKVGQKAMDFTLPDENGKDVSLNELRTNGPVIMSFYRGNWCDYCGIELRALERTKNEFQKHGATLLGISPQTISVSYITKDERNLTYSLLSDAGNRIAHQYGLMFPMSDELKGAFEMFGLDMDEIQGTGGEDTHTFPVPATFVVDAEGTVIYSFVNGDHTQRAEPSDIIACLMSIAQ